MTKTITAVCALFISTYAFATPVATVNCNKNEDSLSRNIQVKKDGDKVTVTIGNIKQEFMNSAVAGYGDLDLLKKVRARYSNGELFQGLNSKNSSVANDILTIQYGKDECAFSKSDSRVVRCMQLGGIGVLIESPVVHTVSANGVDILSKLLTVEISIPMRKEFYTGNIKLKDMLVSSSLALLNPFAVCK